jgi:hypothetical protein
MISPRGAARVAELVEVTTPACVIEPVLEVTERTGTVVVLSSTVPPLVSVTVRVVLDVSVPVVIVPAAAAAESDRVELVVMLPVVIVPEEAVNVVLDEVEMLPVTIVPAETVRLCEPVIAPVVTVPFGAEMLSGLALLVTAPEIVIEPAGAERLTVEEVVSAPAVMLPPVAVILEVPPPAWRRVVTEILPAVEMEDVPPDWMTAVEEMLPALLGALRVSVEVALKLPAEILPPLEVMDMT